MDIKEERLKLLNDTINHFNSTNRSQARGKCSYLPAHESSQGCAIGRLIEDKELCKELDSGKLGGTGVYNKNVFEALPSELKKLGKDFLSDLQDLHDGYHLWIETGLNNSGLKRAEDIKLKYC